MASTKMTPTTTAPASVVNIYDTRGPTSYRKPTSIRRPSFPTKKLTPSTTKTSSTSTYVSKSRDGSNTGTILLGLGALGALALIFWPRSARAGEPSPNTNVVYNPNNPMNVSAVSVAGGPTVGYAGPGNYRVVHPSGLRIRSTANAQGQIVTVPGITTATQVVPQGTILGVGQDARGGWVQITSAGGVSVTGFSCLSCPEGVAGGTGLLPPNLIKVG